MANKDIDIQNKVQLFNDKKIRSVWDSEEEQWYFSVIDVIAVLTDSVNPRDYWFKMKKRVHSEDGIELSTICRQLKMRSPDGKMRETDAANTEALLRIIQSIPSKKAEPFKMKQKQRKIFKYNMLPHGFDFANAKSRRKNVN